MSFAHDAKLEILSRPIENDCCQIAFLSGLFKSCGELSISKGKFKIDIITDLKEIFNFTQKIIKTLYGETLEIEISDDYYINKKTYYRINLPDSITDQITLDTAVMERTENGVEICEGIPNYITASMCCKKAFVKGAFLGAATSNIKLSENATQKTSSGYHLEFTSHNHKFLLDLAALLAEYDLTPKIVARKNIFVLYLKEANQICDVLAMVEATQSVLDLENEIATREMRNKINRETNCFSANISKTVEASFKQLEAIKLINETIGIEKLDEELQEVALLRLANQEESLEELLKLSTLSLTKSGLNHRFRKIIKIAENLKH